MSQLILVIGMSGSGKSTLLREGVEEARWERAFDDYYLGAETLSPEKARDYLTLASNLAWCQAVAVADIAFCDESNRAAMAAAFPNATIVEHWLSTPLEECERRIRERNARKLEEDLKNLEQWRI
jgi:predicted kinase